MSNIAKSVDILTISLSVLYNYFDSPTKLFLDLQQNRPFRIYENNYKSFALVLLLLLSFTIYATY